VLLDHKELMGHKDLLVELVNLEMSETRVNKEMWELLGLLVLPVFKVQKVKTVKREKPVCKAHKVKLVSED